MSTQEQKQSDLKQELSRRAKSVAYQGLLGAAIGPALIVGLDRIKKGTEPYGPIAAIGTLIGAGYGGLRGLLKPGEGKGPSSEKLAIAALLAAASNRITIQAMKKDKNTFLKTSSTNKAPKIAVPYITPEKKQKFLSDFVNKFSKSDFVDMMYVEPGGDFLNSYKDEFYPLSDVVKDKRPIKQVTLGGAVIGALIGGSGLYAASMKRYEPFSGKSIAAGGVGALAGGIFGAGIGRLEAEALPHKEKDMEEAIRLATIYDNMVHGDALNQEKLFKKEVFDAYNKRKKEFLLENEGYLPEYTLKDIKRMDKYIANNTKKAKSTFLKKSSALAEAYVKQANAEKMAPISVANTEVTKPVTPLQKVLLPIATGLYGAALGSKAVSRPNRGAGAIIGGGVGTGAGLLTNYIQALMRKQELDAVKAGR